jgi:hypothetical protein
VRNIINYQDAELGQFETPKSTQNADQSNHYLESIRKKLKTKSKQPIKPPEDVSDELSEGAFAELEKPESRIEKSEEEDIQETKSENIAREKPVRMKTKTRIFENFDNEYDYPNLTSSKKSNMFSISTRKR